MTPSYPHLRAQAEGRKARRAEKVVENEALMSAAGHPGAPPRPAKPSNSRSGIPRRPKKRLKRKKSPSLSKLKKLLWEQMRHVVYAQSEYCVACLGPYAPVACHIVPSSDSAATKFFLPNLYRGCSSCNDAERRRRGQWVKKHEQMFGVEYVDALYEMSKTTFQLKKHWVLEQTARMAALRATSRASV